MKERILAMGTLAAVALGAFFFSPRNDGPTPREDAWQGGPPAHSAARRARTAPPPAGPSEAALLAPLAVGDELSEWELKFIGGVQEGRLPVVFAKDGRVVRLEVVLASADAPEPPAATRRFHIYYRASDVPPDEAGGLARELAGVIAKNGSVPPPAGMKTYEDAGHDPWAEGI